MSFMKFSSKTIWVNYDKQAKSKKGGRYQIDEVTYAKGRGYSNCMYGACRCKGEKRGGQKIAHKVRTY